MNKNDKCHLHESRLKPDRIALRFGRPSLPPGYLAAKFVSFPNSFTMLYGGEPDPITKGEEAAERKSHADVFYCEQCRLNEKDWLDKNR